MRRPSGEYAADQTPSPWPESTASCLAVSASQMRAVWSAEAVTMRRPSGENAAVRTASSWPESTASCLPVAASQMRAVLSLEAVTMRRPSGENAALRTFPPSSSAGRPSPWPERTASCSPLAASQMRAVRSLEAVTMRRPSGENATLRTTLSWPESPAICWTRGRIPDAGDLVAGVGGRRDDNALPVGRIRSVGNVFAKIGQHGELHAAGRVPDVRRVVKGGGDDAPPVG